MSGMYWFDLWKLKNMIEKIISANIHITPEKAPNVKQMQLFASQFSKEQWLKLCKNKSFLNTITENLTECQKIANSILKAN